jgi:orotidine-5'-phosphate decarboxylase
MVTFFEKYSEIVKEKDTVININLDPALPKQRKDNVVPQKFVTEDDIETLLNFSFYVIEEVADYCCSVKPNTQFFFKDSKILGQLAKKIHDNNMIAILDHKLSDIGSTNDSAIYWMSEMGFDAFTFSPFAGNVQKTVESAHSKNLGVIVLTLMSNPEAEKIMVSSLVDNQPFYKFIANEIKKSGADGCVVGLTGFVKPEYVRAVQEIVGDQVIFLLQGIGPQGGSPDNIKFVSSPLVSLGREAIFAENPKDVVNEYAKLFNSLRVKR